MQRGFPLDLLSLVRCSADGGPLHAVAGGGAGWMLDGAVACSGCARRFDVRDGILSLLGPELHPESERERLARDARSDLILQGRRDEWASVFADAIEVHPTLDATGVETGSIVLEIGCGPGRYTMDLAGRARAVVAVDLSRSGLLVLRRKLQPSACVALVQADVTAPYAAPAAFDRALSTLHSNLPTRGHRLAALRQVAQALRPSGRAVISMHHVNAVETLLGERADGRYRDNGIYRHYMRKREAAEETGAFFARVRFAHIAAGVPGLRHAGVARTAARLPLVRSAFSRLFLAVAEQPSAAGLAS